MIGFQPTTFFADHHRDNANPPAMIPFHLYPPSDESNGGLC